MAKQIVGTVHIPIYLSESEQVEGRPPRKEDSAPVSKKPTQPLHGAPKASRPVPSPYVQARAGESLPSPSPGDLPNPGIEPRSPALQADSLPTEL